MHFEVNFVSPRIAPFLTMGMRLSWMWWTCEYGCHGGMEWMMHLIMMMMMMMWKGQNIRGRASNYLLQALVGQCFVLWSPCFYRLTFSHSAPSGRSTSWSWRRRRRCWTGWAPPTSKSSYHGKSRSGSAGWCCRTCSRGTRATTLTRGSSCWTARTFRSRTGCWRRPSRRSCRFPRRRRTQTHRSHWWTVQGRCHRPPWTLRPPHRPWCPSFRWLRPVKAQKTRRTRSPMRQTYTWRRLCGKPPHRSDAAPSWTGPPGTADPCGSRWPTRLRRTGRKEVEEKDEWRKRSEINATWN